jgi:4'-phosphopantetheinyl transferase
MRIALKFCAMNRDNRLWRSPPHELTPPSTRIDVWQVPLGLGESCENNSPAILSPDEMGRAARFRFDIDRNRFVCCRTALRQILELYLDVASAEIRFRYGAKGKPEIEEHQNPHAIRFNVSHSGQFALIGVTSARAVGVDVEKIRPAPDWTEIAERFFSEREYQALLKVPISERARAFFACWTRKEAFVKAWGDGLSYPLRDFSVSVAPDGPAVIEELKADPKAIGRWSVVNLPVAGGYAGAVAFENPRCRIEQWQWTHT